MPSSFLWPTSSRLVIYIFLLNWGNILHVENYVCVLIKSILCLLTLFFLLFGPPSLLIGNYLQFQGPATLSLALVFYIQSSAVCSLNTTLLFLTHSLEPSKDGFSYPQKMDFCGPCLSWVYFHVKFICWSPPWCWEPIYHNDWYISYAYQSAHIQ